MVLWNFIFLGSPVVFTIQWLAAGARITISGPYDPDLPGHSDKHKENGSRGYGCQTRESEIISPINPDRSGGDDGTLWTGENCVQHQAASPPGRRMDSMDSMDSTRFVAE
ncbi:hypothetical protein RJZ56_004824 [Blastomyces dermatitidis]